MVAEPAKWFAWVEAITLATLLVLAGCTTNERSSGVVGRDSIIERDSGGVTLVEYQAAPSSVPTWTIGDSATLTIGSVDGPGATTFGRIGRAGVEKAPGLARRSDGTIVVADQLSRQVSAFDARGRHLWSMGGKGGGPGEFAGIEGVFLMSGDSVGVYDHSARQLKVVSPSGAYAREVPITVNTSVVYARGVLSNGDIIVTSTEDVPLAVGPVRPLQSVRVLAPSGELGVEIGNYDGQEQVYIGEGGRVRGVRSPYMARDGLLAVGRSRVAFTSQDTFEVTIADPVASTRTLFRVEEEPLRVDHAVRERYIDERIRVAERNGTTRSRSDFDEGMFPQTVPAVARLEFDDADRLWVERYSIAADSARVWYVVGKDGRVEARATVPADFEVAAIGERDVVGIYRDELDVPYIQVRTIEKQ
jgi:hypothetical protein